MRSVGAGVVKREHVGEIALQQKPILLGGRQGCVRRLARLGAGCRLCGLAGAGGLGSSECVVEFGFADGEIDPVGKLLQLVQARFVERRANLLDQRHQFGDVRRQRVLADIVDEEGALILSVMDRVPEVLCRCDPLLLRARGGEGGDKLLVVLVVIEFSRQAGRFALDVVWVALSDGGVECSGSVDVLKQTRVLRVILDELRCVLKLLLGGGYDPFEAVGALALATGEVVRARRGRRGDRGRRRSGRLGCRRRRHNRLGDGRRAQRAGIDGGDAQAAFAGIVVVGVPKEAGATAKAVDRQAEASRLAWIAEEVGEQAAMNLFAAAQRVHCRRIDRGEADCAPDSDDGMGAQRQVGGDDARLLSEIAR